MGGGSYRYAGAAGGASSAASASAATTVVATATADVGEGNSDFNGTVVGSKLTGDFHSSGTATEVLNGKLSCVITNDIGAAADFIVRLGSSFHDHRTTDGDHIALYLISIVTDFIGQVDITTAHRVFRDLVVRINITGRGTAFQHDIAGTAHRGIVLDLDSTLRDDVRVQGDIALDLQDSALLNGDGTADSGVSYVLIALDDDCRAVLDRDTVLTKVELTGKSNGLPRRTCRCKSCGLGLVLDFTRNGENHRCLRLDAVEHQLAADLEGNVVAGSVCLYGTALDGQLAVRCHDDSIHGKAVGLGISGVGVQGDHIGAVGVVAHRICTAYRNIVVHLIGPVGFHAPRNTRSRCGSSICVGGGGRHRKLNHGHDHTER